MRAEPRPSRSVLITGMPPATAASKPSWAPVSSAMLGEGDAVAGEQRLVGGDHRAARLERGRDGGLGRAILAADQLDEEIDVGDLARATGSSNQATLGDVDAAVAVAVAGARRR